MNQPKYEKPAIVYNSEITTRAGSGSQKPTPQKPHGVEPVDLFN